MMKVISACALLTACATAGEAMPEATVVVGADGGMMCLERETLELFIRLRDSGEKNAALALITNGTSGCILSKPDLTFHVRPTNNPQILRARPAGLQNWFYLLKTPHVREVFR